MPPAELRSYHHHITWNSPLDYPCHVCQRTGNVDQMLLCDNYNGGYHLFYLKPKLIQVPTSIWYYSSCSHIAPWFLLKPCYAFFDSGLRGGYMKISFQPPLVHYIYMCVCISFWLISFYLWLVLVFLFNRVYYGFTPLWHRTSWHYMSQQRTSNCCFQVMNAYWDDLDTLISQCLCIT
jgi:hypothetical protein